MNTAGGAIADEVVVPISLEVEDNPETPIGWMNGADIKIYHSYEEIKIFKELKNPDYWRRKFLEEEETKKRLAAFEAGNNSRSNEEPPELGGAIDQNSSNGIENEKEESPIRKTNRRHSSPSWKKQLVGHHICPFCPKSYHRQGCLTVHVKRFHTPPESGTTAQTKKKASQPKRPRIPRVKQGDRKQGPEEKETVTVVAAVEPASQHHVNVTVAPAPPLNEAVLNTHSEQASSGQVIQMQDNNSAVAIRTENLDLAFDYDCWLASVMQGETPKPPPEIITIDSDTD